MALISETIGKKYSTTTLPYCYFLLSVVTISMSGFFFAKADNQTQNREVEMSEAKDKIVLPTTSTTTYPGTTWQKVTAAEQGFDATKLEAIKNLMQQYKANGVLVRNGYLIDSWNYAGQPDTQFDIQSCTKTITSLALGLALAEGRIAAIDRPVKEYWPDFDAGPYTEKITFQNLFSKRAAFLLKLRESMQVPDMLRE